MPIRPAQPADAEAMAAIFNQYLAKATMVLEPRAAEVFVDLLQHPRTVALVAEGDAGELLGYAYAKAYSDRGGYSLAGETSIFLDRAARGRGVGSQLYEQLLPAADLAGYRHLTAKIWANNAGSIRFHRQFGFRLLGTQVGIGLVDGKRIDTVLMERVW